MLGQSSLTYCLSEMSRVNFPFLIQEVFVEFLDLLVYFSFNFSFKVMELLLYMFDVFYRFTTKNRENMSVTVDRSLIHTANLKLTRRHIKE
jgi:hypothetical protein